MALTLQQQNFCTDLIALSTDIVTNISPKLNDLNARYNLDQFGTNGSSPIQNTDLAAFAPTAHLTQDKIFAAIVAIQALQAALGDTSDAAHNLSRFTMMKG